jgi:hypothetical protein
VDQSANLVLAVSGITALLEVDQLLGESTVGGGKLEGSEELVDRLEFVTTGEDLVDHILDTDDSVFAKRFLDHQVVGDGLPLLVDVDVSALVDELANGLEVGVT